MTLKDWSYKHVIPSISWGAIHSLVSTLKIRTFGFEEIQLLRRQKKKIVFVLWHGRQMMAVRYLAKKNVCVMSSTSRDGVLQSRILNHFGFTIVFGSSRKSPVRALVGAVKKMQKGFDVAMAVDGPRGPIYKAKPGAVFLAKKSDSFVVPMTFASYPAITMKAWDKYILPIPFSKTAVLYGNPFKLSDDTGEKTIQSECLKIENILNNLTQKAEKLVRRHNQCFDNLSVDVKSAKNT